MPKKADNYFVKVARYQKEHPRSTREHAMKMVSKEISGKKKTVRQSVKKAVKPRKKTIIKTERVTAIGKRKTISHSPVQRGVNIAKKINDLEILLKTASGTVAKNHIKRLINAEHDKLDQITKHLKSA